MHPISSPCQRTGSGWGNADKPILWLHNLIGKETASPCGLAFFLYFWHVKLESKGGKKPLGGCDPIGLSYVQDYKVQEVVPEPHFYPSFKIRKGYISIFPIYTKKYTREQAIEQTKEAVQSEKFKGEISHRSKMKVGGILETWINALQLKTTKNKFKSGYKRPTITFVTLTLSGCQQHDDKWIKRNMLNTFLVWLEDQKKVTEWFWRAEPQKNGRIHFHIVMNGFVEWRDIRTQWNNIQSRHGYIDQFEKDYGHRDPNSTDIHKVQKIDSVCAYVIKYMTKENEGRGIQGRVWGCSRSIRVFKPFISEIGYNEWMFIKDCKKAKGTIVVEGENYTLIKGDFIQLMKEKSPWTYREYEKHLMRCLQESRYGPATKPIVPPDIQKNKKFLGKQGAIDFPL